MVKNKQLIEDVELLLENSRLSDSSDFLVDGIVVTYAGIKVNVSEPIEISLKHEQSVNLSKLFYQQNKDGQKLIVDYLREYMLSGGEVSRTAVNTLVQIGDISAVIDEIRIKFTSGNLRGYERALEQLNQILFCWSGIFTKEQVKSLRSWSSDTLNRKNELGKDIAFSNARDTATKALVRAIYQQTNHILVREVVHRIEAGFNPEINEDEERLKEEFRKFGFPTDLSEALNKIDSKFNESRDAFDFKGCMDLIRAFTERLYRSILDQYEDGKSIDESDSEKVANFFFEKRLVPEHFGKMIVHQRHFLSDLAAHRLKSREEDARLSKNMVIEMSLYLLRRFENH